MAVGIEQRDIERTRRRGVIAGGRVAKPAHHRVEFRRRCSTHEGDEKIAASANAAGRQANHYPVHEHPAAGNADAATIDQADDVTGSEVGDAKRDAGGAVLEEVQIELIAPQLQA